MLPHGRLHFRHILRHLHLQISHVQLELCLHVRYLFPQICLPFFECGEPSFHCRFDCGEFCTDFVLKVIDSDGVAVQGVFEIIDVNSRRCRVRFRMAVISDSILTE